MRITGGGSTPKSIDLITAGFLVVILEVAVQVATFLPGAAVRMAVLLAQGVGPESFSEDLRLRSGADFRAFCRS